MLCARWEKKIKDAIRKENKWRERKRRGNRTVSRGIVFLCNQADFLFPLPAATPGHIPKTPEC